MAKTFGRISKMTCCLPCRVDYFIPVVRLLRKVTNRNIQRNLRIHLIQHERVAISLRGRNCF